MSLYSFDEFINESIAGKVIKKKIAKKVASKAAETGALHLTNASAAAVASRLTIIGWTTSLAGTLTSITVNILNRKSKIKEDLAAADNKKIDAETRKALLLQLEKLNAKEKVVNDKLEKANKIAKAKYDKADDAKKKELLEIGRHAKADFLKKHK